ncbi:MAG: DcaP family trimeric outer membrane transporter [Rikenellaceae bacterium]
MKSIRHYLFAAICCAAILSAQVAGAKTTSAAESKKYEFDFYGFVRADFYYNDRANVASVNELFYLYPMDESLDANGEDLNDVSSSSIYSFVTRMGLDIKGPSVGKAAASAKIEIDFGGYGSFNTLLRIRQAYLNLDWEGGSSLLVGQTWHPLFGSVMPSIANLSTGSPFQPFNRSPMLRYQYKTDEGLKLTAAAVYQLQYTSSGENTTSNEYLVHSCIPELYVGLDYSSGGLLVGGGVNMLNLTPRTQSELGGVTYKVDEHLTAISGEVHVKYTKDKFSVAAKSLYASALDHTLLLGGYAATTVSTQTGEMEYTPIRNSTSWLNVSYGKKWIPYVFVGYTKNLGTSEAIDDSAVMYGRGLNIDQLLGAYCGLKYAMPHWSVAFEYSSTTAWYGDINLQSGRVENTHPISNNRLVGVVTYLF